MLGATRPHSHSMQGGATTQTGPFGSTRRERAGRAHCVVAARLQCRALPRERLLALSPPCTFVVCDKVHNRLWPQPASGLFLLGGFLLVGRLFLVALVGVLALGSLARFGRRL